MRKYYPVIYLTFTALIFSGYTHLGLKGDGYSVGDTAIDFRLKNIDGTKVSLSDYREAKGFIVIFTCNTCPYSRFYEDRINALDGKYAPAGYPVIAINPNDPQRQPGDSFEHMKRRAKEKRFTFPYLVDETQAITAAYGATATPHVYVLQKKNELLKVAYIGAIDNNYREPGAVTKKYVEQAVNRLLDGKEVVEPFTKAIGCSIKWREG